MPNTYEVQVHIPRGSADGQYRIIRDRREVVALIDPLMTMDDPSGFADTLARALNDAEARADNAPEDYAPGQDARACAEGWGIFDSDERGPEIQADAESDIYVRDGESHDDEARGFVERQAALGSEYHKAALAELASRRAGWRAEYGTPNPRSRDGYRIARNDHANVGYYVRPDDQLSFSPCRVYATEAEAWAAFERDC
jgi:hypothetical protein